MIRWATADVQDLPGVRRSSHSCPEIQRQEIRATNFELSDRATDFRERLLAFMDEHVYPAEPVWAEQVRAADSPHVHPTVMEDLKTEARRRGL